jgi:hypothetical protein
MTSILPLDMAGTGVAAREHSEWSPLMEDLVQLSGVPPTLERLERLAYTWSVPTATALQSSVVDSTMGTTTDRPVAHLLAVVYLRTAAVHLRYEPAMPSVAAQHQRVDCVRMILPVRTRTHHWQHCSSACCCI